MTNQKYISGAVRKMTPEQRDLMIEQRVVPFIASTAAIDRHGTVVNMENWNLQNFLANPIAGYQHNVYGDEMCMKPTPDDIIGKWVNIRIENGELRMDLQFKPEGRSELADKIFLDCVDGYLNAVSVGFIAMEQDGKEYRMGNPEYGEDPSVKYFFGQELLEVSVVNIPANPEALKRSLRDQTSNALKFIQRKLDLRFSDIENMKVKDVLDALEGKKGNKEKDITPTVEWTIDGWRSTRTLTDEEVEMLGLFKENEKEEQSNDSESSALNTAEARKRVQLLTINKLKLNG